MATLPITEADRNERGAIMLEAERRAAERNAVPDPAPAASPDVAGEPSPLPPATPRPVRAISPTARLRTDKPGAPPLTRPQLVAAAVVAVLFTLALIAAIVRATPAPTARPLVQPTAPAPTTAPPTSSPVPTPFGASLGRAVVAYFDYQRPETATALEPSTRVQPIVRIGQQWVLLQLSNGGEVWVRYADAPGDVAELPDRAPTPVPPSTAPPASQPAPAVGAPVPCDESTAPFRVPREVPPYGRVEGVSCVSLDEAASNADALAAELRATAEARPTTAPPPP